MVGPDWGIGTGNLLSRGSHIVIYGTDISGWENYGDTPCIVMKTRGRIY